MRSIGVYVHIPFCSKKCGYCDFNAYSGYKETTKARYVDALCREILARAVPDVVVPTIFFGGGTPTNLPAADLVRILNTIRETFAVAPDAEISTEANPSDVSPEFLATLREAGFNRLSFGVQTFNDHLLTLIDRVHTSHTAKVAVQQAKDAGFDNLSLDLMFALPRQTLADWERTLDEAFALAVPHLSMYALIVEEGTPFFARRERGRLSFPSEKTEAAMFARAIERATSAGYEHYEISNYARPGFRCRHNHIYWHNEDYFGFGAGAVSYLNGERITNIRRPGEYISGYPLGVRTQDSVKKEEERSEKTQSEGSGLNNQHPTTNTQRPETERLSVKETMGETVMLGLRLREGLNLERFAGRFGVRAEVLYREVIARYTERGLLEAVAGHLRLTKHGLFLANDVMADFLS